MWRLLITAQRRAPGFREAAMVKRQKVDAYFIGAATAGLILTGTGAEIFSQPLRILWDDRRVRRENVNV